LYEAYINAAWSFWLRKNTGQLASYLSSESLRVFTAFDQVNLFLSNAILIVVFLFVALSLSAKFTILFLIAGILITLAMSRRFVDFHVAGQDISTQNKAIHQLLHEQLSAAKLIKTSAMEDSSRDLFTAAVSKLNDTEIRASTAQHAIEGVLGVFILSFL